MNESPEHSLSTSADPSSESLTSAVSLRSALHRWPSALGLLAAVFQLVTGASRDTVAITLCVATMCYLGAAALGRPWVAWAGIPAGSLLVTVGEIVGLPLWAILIIVAAALLVLGLCVGVPRRPLTAQALALLGFGGAAVVGLLLTPWAGVVLTGLALASHAVWDLVHYRRNVVVLRSLAEFCIVLDVALGVGFIVVFALAG